MEFLMKRILLFISIIFICTNLFAQDWQLFNTDFITYYRSSAYSNIVNEKIDQIFEFQFEKNKISENNFQFTSTRIKPKNYYDSCLFTIRQQYNIKAFGEDDFLIDMYNLTNDTLYFYYEIFGKLRNKSYKFILPLNMDKSDSLLINKIKIKFIESKRIKVLEGLFDSAKVFSLENISNKPTTISYITLTQHYGIIEHLFYNKLKLCGLKRNDGGESYGYIPRKSNISNLLNLKVGDYKIWKTEIFEMGKNDEVYYSKDVCNSVTFNGDSILIEFECTQFKEEKPWKIYGVKETYLKSLWDEMCSNRQNTTHFINFPPKYNDDNKMGISIVEGAGYLVYQDSTNYSSKSFIEYINKGEYLIGECQSRYPTDHYLKKIISTEVGELYSRGLIGLGEGSITNRVIGFYRDGKQYGEIPDYLTVKELAQNDKIISPNPATDYINIDMSFLRMQESEIKIYDILGNEMHPPRQTSSDTPQEGNLHINISTMPPGVYFVRIGNEKPMKFVKI